MEDLNEQDILDLKEIKMLEKMATLRESSGVATDEQEHQDFIEGSQKLID